MISRVRIGDLGEVITGNTPPRNKPEYYGSHTPFIKATDIDESSKYTYSPEESYSEVGYKKYRKSLIPKGSTCVVTIGSIGKKMTMAHCDCFINQAMNAIIPSADYDPEYVYYVVKNNVHRLKSLDSGTASGRENVSKSAFSNLEIDVIDDIGTQKRIGSVLSNYDDLIENNQKQIKLLEEAAQRLYKEWFVDLRFPGHETTPIVDGVPEGWKKDSLGGICTLKKDTVSAGKIPVGTPYIGLEHMPRVDFCLSSWGNAEEITSNKFQYTEDDIIFGKIRPYFHKVGFALNSGVVSTDSFVLKANDGLWGLLLMTVFDKLFVDYTYQTCKEGAKMPRADWGQMEKYPVLIPPESVRQDFEEFIWNNTRRVKALALQNHALAEARDRLLPKLISGEIEV